MVLHSMLVSRDQDLGGRNGLLYFHTPILNKVVTASILILIFSWLIRRFYFKDKSIPLWLWYSAALILAGLAVFNEQLITGKTLWPYHFVQYTIPVTIVILMVSQFHLWHKKFPKMWKAFIALTAIISIGFGIFTIPTYKYALGEFKQHQRYVDLFKHLNTTAPKGDCVVLDIGDEPLKRMTPAYTSCDIYDSYYVFFGIPLERVHHNYMVIMRLAGVTPATSEQYLLDHQEHVRAYFYENWDQMFATTIDPWYLATVSILREEYSDFYKKPFARELQKYKVDYVVSEKPLSPDIARLLPIQSTVKQGTFYISTLSKPK